MFVLWFQKAAEDRVEVSDEKTLGGAGLKLRL